MREHSLRAEPDLSPSIPEAQARELAREGSCVTMEKGEELYRQGEPADRLFLLNDGRIKASSVNALGQETVLRIHLSGSVLGLTSLAIDPVRDATATALEDSSLICASGCWR